MAFLHGFYAVLSAVQLGSAVGHLARTTLGPYEIPVPRPGNKLLVVPANVAHFAESMEHSNPDEVRLLGMRTRRHHAHRALQAHVAERLRALLVQAVEGMAEDVSSLARSASARWMLTEPDALQRLLGDPEVHAGGRSYPRCAAGAAADLDAVAVVLVDYVEHVLDRAAERPARWSRAPSPRPGDAARWIATGRRAPRSR